MVIDPGQEETVFWLFAGLMVHRGYRSMFLPKMQGLRDEIAELEAAVHKFYPRLA